MNDKLVRNWGFRIQGKFLVVLIVFQHDGWAVLFLVYCEKFQIV